MSAICGRCGHPPHEDTGTANFCFRMTGNGLCGCENYVEDYPDDGPAFEPDPMPYCPGCPGGCNHE